MDPDSTVKGKIVVDDRGREGLESRRKDALEEHDDEDDESEDDEVEDATASQPVAGESGEDLVVERKVMENAAVSSRLGLSPSLG